jgi:hypothetical protein
MKKLLNIFFLFYSFNVCSQEYKDTTFSVRGFSCTCKYPTTLESENKLFSRSEKAAYYPGEENEWKKFLKKNLKNNFKGKKEEFRVQFVVNKDGDLSDYRLLDRAPNQKYEEVLRVLKLSGKWFPATQNGHCVTSYYSVLFRF